jgi:hypothetical protein
MLLAEWNMDKALEVRGREAWEDGRQEGRVEGVKIGETKGRVEGVKIGETKGRAEGQAELLSLLQSGKSPAEILKQYGYKS